MSPATSNGTPLLEIDHVSKHFPIERGILKRVTGHIRAVEDVSLSINEGETLGLVGESGSGKTTLGRCVLRAIEPTSGKIRFRYPDGRVLDLATLDKRELQRRRRHMHMIFQDPYSSLDPRMTVFDIVGEPLRLNGAGNRAEMQERVEYLMSVVGLEREHLHRYPHAFSGGQRQRIGIARSLALNPELIVCDEAVSALDVSVQAQILNLLRRLQAEFHLTYLFIAHNLSVVRHISDRVAVMYLGRIVELAKTDELFLTPRHPYSEALLSAVPKVNARTKMNRIVLSGEIPNPAATPSGCPFHTRCRYAEEICRTDAPAWNEVVPGHFAACHFSETLQLKGIHGEAVNA